MSRGGCAFDGVWTWKGANIKGRFGRGNVFQPDSTPVDIGPTLSPGVVVRCALVQGRAGGCDRAAISSPSPLADEFLCTGGVSVSWSRLRFGVLGLCHDVSRGRDFQGEGGRWGYAQRKSCSHVQDGERPTVAVQRRGTRWKLSSSLCKRLALPNHNNLYLQTPFSPV